MPRRVNQKCFVEGCQRAVRAQRYCSMHAARIQRHGNPHTVKNIFNLSVEEFSKRFESYVYRTHSCWFWIGVRQFDRFGEPFGYGMFGKYPAHRTAYELYKGPIPVGMRVLHSCDTPQCVNPSHLSAGTAKDNVQDALKKGHMNGGKV